MGTGDATMYDGAVCPAGALASDPAATAATPDGAGTDAAAGTQVLAPDPVRTSPAVLSPGALGGVIAALAPPLSQEESGYVRDRLSQLADITDADVTAAQIAVATGRGVTLVAQTLDPAVQPEFPGDAVSAPIGGGSAGDWWAAPLGDAVAAVAAELRREIAAEWAGGISATARQGFQDGAATVAGVRHVPDEQAFAYYRRIRALMYQQGWTDPARYWRDIVPARLCGVEIRNGVHRLALERLQGPGVDLTTRSNTADGARIVTSVVGFQPRTIAGTRVLSNHAWGLAIDVNPDDNPFLTNRDVFRIIRDHTSDRVDLGARLDAANLDARIAVIRKASREIAAWLTAAIPRLLELTALVERATADLARAEMSHDQAGIDTARQRLADANEAYRTDPLVPDDVVRLEHVVGAKTVAHWSVAGILNLPDDLIAQFEGETPGERFGWGGEYEHRKDFMHFEIDARKALPR